MGFSLDPSSESMPGYWETVRKAHSGDFRVSWNYLDLYSAKVAEGFLMPKIKRLTDDEKTQEHFLQIALGFATMAVHGDREEQESLQRFAEAREAEAPARPDTEGDDDLLGPPGLSW